MFSTLASYMQLDYSKVVISHFLINVSFIDRKKYPLSKAIFFKNWELQLWDFLSVLRSLGLANCSFIVAASAFELRCELCRFCYRISCFPFKLPLFKKCRKHLEYERPHHRCLRKKSWKSQGERYKLFLQTQCGKTKKPTIIDKYYVKIIYWLISKKVVFTKFLPKNCCS